MSLIAIILVDQAVTASDLRPDAFYVAGIQQEMTHGEYNALIANGGFSSKPVSPDTYDAVIAGKDVFVRFCQGRV